MEYELPELVIESAEETFRNLPRDVADQMATLLSESYRRGHAAGQRKAASALAILS